jgi:CRP-like cAMP-binding protein
MFKPASQHDGAEKRSHSMSGQSTAEATTNKTDQGKTDSASLAAEGQKIFSNIVPFQPYPAGVELFQQGSPAYEVYFIARGLVKLVYLGQNGQEMIVGLRSPGWILGAASVILGKSCPTTVATLTDCHLHKVPADVFLNQLKNDAPLSWYVQLAQSLEIYEETAHVAQLGCVSAQDRLEQLLWQFCSMLESNKSQKEIRLQLPLKKQEIAELIAVTPEYLSLVVKRMQQQGIIRWNKSWLIIYDFQSLWHMTDF